MSRMTLGTLACAAAALCLGTTDPAGAVVFNEIGDAGDLPSNSQSVVDDTTQILGAGGAPDINMYGFSWPGGGLTIDTSGSSFDTILYLFDGAGLGIAGNDDAIGFQAQLVFGNLPMGDYLLAVGYCCAQPLSAGGHIFPFVVFDGQYGPTGPGGGQPIIAWDFPSAAGFSPYQVNFSAPVNSTAVPEPGTLALLGAGIATVVLVRRRRRADA